METGNLNISSMSFSFNEFMELVKRLSDKEKQQLKAFLKKETNPMHKRGQTKSHLANKKGGAWQAVSPETDDTKLKVSDFSFLETQDLLKDCKVSFSEEVIAERREAL